MAFEYPILDPFHKRLYKALHDDYQSRVTMVISGGAFRTGGDANSADPLTTGEKYAKAVGYLECMNVVFELCRSIEVKMHGGEREGFDG